MPASSLVAYGLALASATVLVAMGHAEPYTQILLILLGVAVPSPWHVTTGPAKE